MDLEEKTMKSEKIYEGKIINLRIDTVELPDKKYSKREIVEHPGSVVIIAIKDNDSLLLVRQFRKSIEKTILELPAGKIELNEEPKVTALRELEEETGYSANKLEFLFEIFPSPGIIDERMFFFLARDLYKINGDKDYDEYLTLKSYKIDQLMQMVNRGEIKDGKTLISILYANEFLIK